MEDNINESKEILVNSDQSKIRRKKWCVIGTITILGVLLLATILFFALSKVTDPEVKGFLLNSKCATDIQ